MLTLCPPPHSMDGLCCWMFPHFLPPGHIEGRFCSFKALGKKIWFFPPVLASLLRMPLHLVCDVSKGQCLQSILVLFWPAPSTPFRFPAASLVLLNSSTTGSVHSPGVSCQWTLLVQFMRQKYVLQPAFSLHIAAFSCLWGPWPAVTWASTWSKLWSSLASFLSQHIVPFPWFHCPCRWAPYCM